MSKKVYETMKSLKRFVNLVELICLAGGLPLRGCVFVGGLMLRKQITKRVKGAEKN